MRVCSFILILVLANLFVESGAFCGGCQCNIWGCNCTWRCGDPTHCPTGCSGCWPFCGDSSSNEKTTALEKSVEKCCNKKDVGGVSYTLVPGLPNAETHPRHCIDGCVYTQDGTANKFCFAKGDLKVECGDQSPISIGVNPNGNCTAELDRVSGKCVFPVDNCNAPATALAQPLKCDPCNCVVTA